METPKETTERRIVIGLISLCIIGAIIAIFLSKRAYDTITQKIVDKQVEKLQNTIDSLKQDNVKIVERIKVYEQQSADLYQKTKDIDNQIQKIKNDEKSKIRDFDTYTASMWQKYFADRYKDK